MIEGAFRNSVLEMATEPQELALETSSAIGDWVTSGLVLLFILLALITMRDFFRLAPALNECMRRWKGNVTLEHSLQLMRSRNFIATCYVIPFCLISDRYDLYDPEYLELLPSWSHVLIMLGIVFGYRILRLFVGIIRRPYRLDLEYYHTAQHTVLNFLLMLVPLLLGTAGISAALHIPDGFTHDAMICEIAIFYLISFIRTAQILDSRCSALTTILYLCALEFVPTGLVIASAVML